MPVGRGCIAVLLVILAVSHRAVSQAINWGPVDEVLQSGIHSKVFPGCAAAVVTEKVCFDNNYTFNM